MNEQLLHELVDISGLLAMYQTALDYPDKFKGDPKDLKEQAIAKFLILGIDSLNVPDNQYVDFTIRQLKVLYPNESDFIELGKIYTIFALLSVEKIDSEAKKTLLLHIRKYLTKIFGEEQTISIVNELNKLESKQIIKNLHDLIEIYCYKIEKTKHNSIKEIIEEYIAKYEIDKALSTLTIHFKKNEDQINLKTVIMLISQNSKLKMESNLGVIAKSESDMETNRIIKAILELI